MLSTVLKLFKEELTDHFKRFGVINSKIEFPSSKDGTRESIDFVNEALNIMMVNLEEEKTLRQADLFQHQKDGKGFKALPEIRLNMYLLFVANRSNYLTSMDMLSMVFRFFLTKRVFDKSNTPRLSNEIQRLTIELVTLPFAEQNEVWNALRTSYKPSVLYKVRMIVFSPDAPLEQQPNIQEIKIENKK